MARDAWKCRRARLGDLFSTLAPVAFADTESGCAGEADRILAAAVQILSQGEDLLRAITLERYTKRVPLAFNGSIGGHYRHCLDVHFTSLLRALDSGAGAIQIGASEIRALRPSQRSPESHQTNAREFAATDAGRSDQSVRTRCEVSYVHGDSPLTVSTYGRELVYAIAHAIHHYALISVMAGLLQVVLPLHFGVAPSTVAHQSGIKAR